MSLEAQIVSGLAGLLSLVVSALLAYLGPKAKTFLDAHLSAKGAEIANTVIDGLAAIAEAVVQDFNQRIVAEAKAHGVWGPQLAQSVKNDAVAAVKSQGAALIALGQEVLGDMDSLVSSLIETAVVKYHVSVPAQPAQPQQPAQAS